MKNFQDILLKIVLEYYLNSHDYNGIGAYKLNEQLKIEPSELIRNLAELVENKKCTLTFVKASMNPSIKRFPDLDIKTQLDLLNSEPIEEICIYPAEDEIKNNIDLRKYENAPFTKKLILGEAQLQPYFFDLSVLERYLNDPRYIFKFYDYGGSISLSDKYYLNNNTQEKDKVFIKTFGLGYKPSKERVITVFLYYLSKLNSEHQMYWKSFIINNECKISPPYYENNILGKWVEEISVYEAFLLEMIIINNISEQLKRPKFFRKLYLDNRPKEFSAFVRPTYKNYLYFIHILDKMISENINIKFFKNDVKIEEEKQLEDGRLEVIKRGSLAILDDWLKKNNLKPNYKIIDEIISTFKNIRKHRQKQAHTIIKDNYDLNYYNEQNNLISDVWDAMRKIRILLMVFPEVESPRELEIINKNKIMMY